MSKSPKGLIALSLLSCLAISGLAHGAGNPDDVATPPESLRTLADASGSSAPTILANTGHVPSVERPQDLTRLLLEHCA